MHRVLSALHERLTTKPLGSASLREYSERWLKERTSSVQPVTLQSYKTAVKDLIAFLPEKSSLPLQYITSSDLAQFQAHTAEKSSAPTANHKLKIIRVLFQSAWREGIIPENVSAKVRGLSTEDTVRRPFTLPELKKLLAVASGEWQGMLLAGLYSGQRLRDIALLQWANLDLVEKTLTLRTSKTNRTQEIPLAEPLADYIVALQSGDDPKAYVFPLAADYVVRDGNTNRLSQQFYEIMVNAGLAKVRTRHHHSQGKGRNSTRERNELSFHALRHTATSLLKNAGVSEAVARDIIGHDSAAISRHYTHVELKAKRSALSKLPDVRKKNIIK